MIAVDPGLATGIAWLHSASKTWEAQSVTLSPMEAVSHVRGLLLLGLGPEVACENFVPRPGAKSWQPDALHVIGALRWLCYEHGVPFTLQTPAEAKRFCTDAKLKRVGLWHPTEGGHENDARRHLLLALVRAGKIDVEQLLEEE